MTPFIDHPVFVFGSERSGTTVLRLMIDAHPGLSNPGEFDFLFDNIRPSDAHPTGWVYDRDELSLSRNVRRRQLHLPADKDGLDLLHDMIGQITAKCDGQISLNVHGNADLATRIFPHARFIHLLRDPRDVALSSVGMGWTGTLYHGVDRWLHTEETWDRVAQNLSPEQVHTMTYEGLFRDTEAVLSNLCDFLWVPFDAAMLNFYENTSYGPPNARSVERFRKHADAQDIAFLQGKAQNMMAARGYDLVGEARAPGFADKLRLGLRNKLYNWSFGMKRHGAGLFLAEKLTRALRLQKINRQLVTRMRTTVDQELK